MSIPRPAPLSPRHLRGACLPPACAPAGRTPVLPREEAREAPDGLGKHVDTRRPIGIMSSIAVQAHTHGQPAGGPGGPRPKERRNQPESKSLAAEGRGPRRGGPRRRGSSRAHHPRPRPTGAAQARRASPRQPASPLRTDGWIHRGSASPITTRRAPADALADCRLQTSSRTRKSVRDTHLQQHKRAGRHSHTVSAATPPRGAVLPAHRTRVVSASLLPCVSVCLSARVFR